MSRIRLLSALLAIIIAVGCEAQSTPLKSAAQSAQDLAALNRHIRVLIRSQFNIPAEYTVSVGARKPSKFAGYDTLPVVFSHGSSDIFEEFLISTDNKTLSHFDNFDLTNDAAFTIDVTGRPIRGNPDAKVTVVNFDDLQCPFCARMHNTLFPATLDRYKDKVRFVYKDYPLPPEMHPWAMHAAVDANCLAAQSGDAYWKYVDYIHPHRQEISGPNHDAVKSATMLDMVAREQAAQAHLDAGKLDGCLAAQDESKVRESIRLADPLKFRGPPALYVNGEYIDGAVPQDQLWTVIDRALRDACIEPPPMPPLPAPQPAPSGTGN
ncbi:MAG: DsbA family protein [Terracidiphilus sp.]